MREVDGEQEVDMGLEAVTKTALPVFAHLSLEKVSQLIQVFQDASSLFAASPGKTAFIEHVIHLKDGQPMRQCTTTCEVAAGSGEDA